MERKSPQVIEDVINFEFQTRIDKQESPSPQKKEETPIQNIPEVVAPLVIQNSTSNNEESVEMSFAIPPA